MERCKVLAARSIGHPHLEVARNQEVVRSIAPEAGRNTHIGQRQSDRSGDRQRNRIHRRGQQKAAGP